MMEHDDSPMPAVHDAVQSYVEALLEPDTGEAPTPSASEGTDGAIRYCVAHVSSVRLALPATWLDPPLPLPPLLAYSAPDWFLGRYRLDGVHLHVFDLAHVTAPEIPRAQPAVMIPVRGRPWAIACTLEDAPLRLARSAVRWREPSPLRPWLAGMTADGTCAVLDVPALLSMLEHDPRFQPEPPTS